MISNIHKIALAKITEISSSIKLKAVVPNISWKNGTYMTMSCSKKLMPTAAYKYGLFPEPCLKTDF